MPIIAAIFGKPNFDDLTFTIHHSVFQYGAFITALITFVSIAAAVFFFVVKPVQMIRARGATDEDELAPTDEERRHQELVATIRSISR
jgi:large conductance mechanosensitive channel